MSSAVASVVSSALPDFDEPVSAPTPKSATPLYLIDASVFIFRAYHSVPLSLTDPDGNPVNALHGFGRFLGDLIEQVRPEHIAVAFDETVVV